jgi:hypothetical protein
LQDGVIPAGLVVDYTSSGMKELDALGVEIDKLRRSVIYEAAFIK